MKRSLDSPRPTGEPPPAKIPKTGASSRDASDSNTRARWTLQHGNTPLQEDQPKDKAVPDGQDAARKSGADATHESMTPESTGRAGTDRQTHQRHAPKEPRPTSDEIRRDQADINTYRAHFSGYQKDSAHVSSNPFVESDERLQSADDQRNLPEREGAHTHESDSLPSPERSGRRMSKGTDDAPRSSTTLAQMSNDSRGTVEGRSQPPHCQAGPSKQDESLTKGDRGGNWTERVRDLQRYADSHGANLRSLSANQDDTANFRSHASGNASGDEPEKENDVHGQEATMALYSYPRLESGRRFFAQVPEHQKEELEKVRKELQEMEDQLRDATKQRIDEVSATLDKGPPGGASAPHGSSHNPGCQGGT